MGTHFLEKKNFKKSSKWLSVNCAFREQSVTYRSIGFNEPSHQSYRGLGTGRTAMLDLGATKILEPDEIQLSLPQRTGQVR